jgi:hypothetical protein
MRLRFVLPALMIGAGLLLPVQPPALAKTSYKYQKFKKYKKYKVRKFKGAKVGRHKAVKHQMRQRV